MSRILTVCACILIISATQSESFKIVSKIKNYFLPTTTSTTTVIPILPEYEHNETHQEIPWGEEATEVNYVTTTEIVPGNHGYKPEIDSSHKRNQTLQTADGNQITQHGNGNDHGENTFGQAIPNNTAQYSSDDDNILFLEDVSPNNTNNTPYNTSLNKPAPGSAPPNNHEEPLNKITPNNAPSVSPSTEEVPLNEPAPEPAQSNKKGAPVPVDGGKHIIDAPVAPCGKGRKRAKDGQCRAEARK